MRIEIHSAADFVMNLLRVKHKKDFLTENQLENFKKSLSDFMFQSYQRHWYPDLPTKGSGYRCLRINGKMDPIIEQAGVAVGLHPRILRKMLPQELTMWIDPDEVAYRIGENGSICVLYDTVQIRSSPSSDLSSNVSGNGNNSEEFIMERRLDLSDVSLIDYLHVGSGHSNMKLNNSANSSSPPLSPHFLYHNNNTNRYNRQKQHQQHQPQHQQHHNNQQHHPHNNNIHHQSHIVENPMYHHWDNGFNNFNNFNNKVRTQC